MSLWSIEFLVCLTGQSQYLGVWSKIWGVMTDHKRRSLTLARAGCWGLHLAWAWIWSLLLISVSDGLLLHHHHLLGGGPLPLQGQREVNSQPCWTLFLSKFNSIRFAPKLETVNFSSNLIEEITNLTGLPHLRNIDFTNNKIKDVESLHTKVGQIHTLNLSHNMIRNLHGMSKLYSVTNLDVADNKLRTLADVSTVAQLPCIEKLQISPNKVNNEVDYRLKVLEGYGGRCGEVRLDELETSQAEMDKVSVLMALR